MKTSNSKIIRFDMEIAVIHSRFFVRRYSHTVDELTRLCRLGFRFFCHVQGGKLYCFSEVPKISTNGRVVSRDIVHREVTDPALVEAMHSFLYSEEISKSCILFEVRGNLKVLEDLGEVLL